MRKKYIILDVYKNEYFYTFHAAAGFNHKISNATQFNSEAAAINEIEFYNEIFQGRLIEIKCYYFIDMLE